MLLLDYTPSGKIEAPKMLEYSGELSLTNPYIEYDSWRRFNMNMMLFLALSIAVTEDQEQREKFEQVFDDNVHKLQQ